jgi:hypothetical protein
MSAFFSVLALIVFLAAYEGVRAIVALRRGDRFILVTKDFIAAAVVGGIVVLILWVWHEYFRTSWAIY